MRIRRPVWPTLKSGVLQVFDQAPERLESFTELKNNYLQPE
jgi:hypothetical protein